jgi:hypothetical protein
VAVVSFSLFFASLAASFVIRESRARGERLQADADDLLAAMMSDPRWTSDHGLFRAAELTHMSTDDVRGLAAGRPFLVVVWDLFSDERWMFGGEEAGGDRRTAATSANVLGPRVDPARVVVTVWGS